MDRLISALTLYRFGGCLVAVDGEADIVQAEFRRLGARFFRQRPSGRLFGGVPDAEPWRSRLLGRMAQLGVTVTIVDGEPPG